MDLTYAPLLAWLLLAHLLADFPLQPLSWVEDKIQHRARSRFLVLHALLHGVLAAWVVAGFGLLHGGFLRFRCWPACCSSPSATT